MDPDLGSSEGASMENSTPWITRSWLESRIRDRIPSHFGMVVRRARLIEADQLAGVEAALDDGRLSEGDFEQLLALGAIVLGRDRSTDEKAKRLLAVEVALTIDRDAIQRAIDRAAILVRAGYRAMPAVAGRAIEDADLTVAKASNVVVYLTDGDVESGRLLARP